MNGSESFKEILIIISNQLGTNKGYCSKEISVIMRSFGLGSKITTALKYNMQFQVLNQYKRGKHYVHFKR